MGNSYLICLKMFFIVLFGKQADRDYFRAVRTENGASGFVIFDPPTMSKASPSSSSAAAADAQLRETGAKEGEKEQEVSVVMRPTDAAIGSGGGNDD